MEVALLMGGTALLLSLSACENETLYPEMDLEGGEVVVAPHTVSVRLPTLPARLQIGDSIPVEVSAQSRGDGSPIGLVGATLLVRTSAGIERVASGRSEVAPATSGPVTLRFNLPIDAALARRLSLPGRLDFEVHGFAVNTRAVCVAAVEARPQQLPCAEIQGQRIAAGAMGPAMRTEIVAGRTVPLPAGAAVADIADMVADPGSGHLFLSNRPAHRVEVLELESLQFRSPISVGSEPWGLAMNRTGDTLMVANSGGTNISFVPTPSLREDLSRRLELPRVTLYDLNPTKPTILEFHNYTDRPHFLAQDAVGRLFYSVVPTQASPAGTIRTAQWRDGWRTWDTSLLFPEGILANTPPVTHRAVVQDLQNIAIANVDSINLIFGGPGPIARWLGTIVIYDHRPGYRPGDPDYLIRSDTLPPLAAIWQMYKRRSDIIAYPGYRWNLPKSAEMADTTFVASSGDRSRIIFGELPRSGAGRIVLWDARAGALSRVEDIHDLVNNTSDRITGIDLNRDGSIGVAHGEQAAYFFDPMLRLQGLAAVPEGRGVALLSDVGGRGSLAFVGTAEGTIDVLETSAHYRRVGTIPIRDPLVGPLRVISARGVNACPDLQELGPECVVARLYGITSAGVVEVEVLRRHLNLD